MTVNDMHRVELLYREALQRWAHALTIDNPAYDMLFVAVWQAGEILGYDATRISSDCDRALDRAREEVA